VGEVLTDGRVLWLASALGTAGLDVVELPGWQECGHGPMTELRGVMVHHTGSDTATAQSLAAGRPDLAGPLAHLHIARTGTVTVLAAGAAWHAGAGELPWVPADRGNRYLVGIECANTGTAPDAPHRQNWPDAQYLALVAVCGAMCARLRLPAARVVGHREYAGRAQGKWDPGAIDLAVLRGDIEARLAPGQGLRGGDHGPRVARLQRRLRAAYAAYAGHLAVDGDFGPRTDAAVREFQRRSDGLTVDGVVGPVTAAALRLDIAAP
jgi:N-acetyl-anhydromuramyl-L-alanine amidase AmpD